MEMDTEFNSFMPQTQPSAVEGARRIWSAQKMRYDAEIDVIRKTHGGLEDMRQKLGLSRRQLCRILMVDPSAWTRWTSPTAGGVVGVVAEKAPAHVYKMLAMILEQGKPVVNENMAAATGVKWDSRNAQLELDKKVAELRAQMSQVLDEQSQEQRLQLRSEVQSQIESIRQTFQKGSELAFGYKLLVLLNTVLVLYALFR